MLEDWITDKVLSDMDWYTDRRILKIAGFAAIVSTSIFAVAFCVEILLVPHVWCYVLTLILWIFSILGICYYAFLAKSLVKFVDSQIYLWKNFFSIYMPWV